MSDGFPPQAPKGRTGSKFIMVDVETDGPIPGDYSMIAFAAVVVEPELNRTFKRYVRPLAGASFDSEALAVGGFTRAETLSESRFIKPADAMFEFREWIESLGLKKAIFIADNNGFDWQFVNWYFHHFLGENPFGFSSQNLNSIYKGLTLDCFASFKHLRKTKHDHDPLNDARGNAEALLHMMHEMGLKA